jgi:hypothetical protein
VLYLFDNFRFIFYSFFFDILFQVLSEDKIWNTTLLPLVTLRLEECIDLKDYIGVKLKKYLDADAETNDYTASIMEEHESLFGGSLPSGSVRSSVRSPRHDTARLSEKSSKYGNTPRSKGERIKALKDSMKESDLSSKSSLMSKRTSYTKTITALSLQQQDQLTPLRFEGNQSMKSQYTHRSLNSGRNLTSYIDQMEGMSLNSGDFKGTLSKSEHSLVMYK